MIDRKYQRVVFAFFMALLMSCVISFVISVLNPDYALGSQQSPQVLDAPSARHKLLITNKVITRFWQTLCTSIPYPSFRDPNA